MKAYKKIGIAFVLGIFVTSCIGVNSNGNHGLPLGQVKKSRELNQQEIMLRDIINNRISLNKNVQICERFFVFSGY